MINVCRIHNYCISYVDYCSIDSALQYMHEVAWSFFGRSSTPWNTCHHGLRQAYKTLDERQLTKPVMGETLHWFPSISWCAQSSKEWSSCYQLSMPINFHENMHEVFHSFPPTSPSSAPIWWGAISCREWWRWHTSSVVTSNYMIYTMQCCKTLQWCPVTH